MPDYEILKMIATLREKEVVVLTNNITILDAEEKQTLGEYLSIAYKAETADYPYLPPSFNEQAAIWGAEMVYSTAQFIVNRKVAEETISLNNIAVGSLFPYNPSTILSVDLCFRFIPSMIKQLHLIDKNDKCIVLLEKELMKWHYSGVPYHLQVEELNFELILANNCLKQLYLNRIIDFKNMNLAKHGAFKNLLKANMGIFESDFWTEFNLKE